MGRGQSDGSREGAETEAGSQGSDAGAGVVDGAGAEDAGGAEDAAGPVAGGDGEPTEVTGFNRSTETVTALSLRRILNVFSDLSKTGNGPS